MIRDIQIALSVRLSRSLNWLSCGFQRPQRWPPSEPQGKRMMNNNWHDNISYCWSISPYCSTLLVYNHRYKALQSGPRRKVGQRDPDGDGDIPPWLLLLLDENSQSIQYHTQQQRCAMFPLSRHSHCGFVTLIDVIIALRHRKYMQPTVS